MPSVPKLISKIPKLFKGTRKLHNANTLTPPKSTNTPTPPKRTLRIMKESRQRAKEAERQAKFLAEYTELFGSRTYDPNINHSFYGVLEPPKRINLNNRENLRDIPLEQIMDLNIMQLRDFFKSLKNNEPTKEDINAELHRQEKIKDSIPEFVARQKQLKKEYEERQKLLKKEHEEREMMGREDSRTKTVSRRGGRRRHTKKRHSLRH
jgi:hypothetical protein